MNQTVSKSLRCGLVSGREQKLGHKNKLKTKPTREYCLTHLPTRCHWGDCFEFLRVGWCRKHKHHAKFCDSRFRGFGSYDTPNFAILHRNSWSPFQHCKHYHATLWFVNFTVSLDSSTSCTVASSIVHSKLISVILCTINYLSLNYPVSSISRTLLLVLSWKLPSHVISLLSYALFTGSGSLNASNTSSSHLPTKFWELPKLHTFISSSPLALHRFLLVHQHHSH